MSSVNSSDLSSFSYPLMRQLLSLSRAEFESAAEQHSFLYHQLLFSPRDPLPDEAWMQFAEANKVRHLDGLWEDWQVSPTGLCCGHLYGRSRVV